MARISKVNEATMTEDITKRSDDREKFVTEWKEVKGRRQRTAVFRKYNTPVYDKGVALPEKSQADFEDVIDIEYLNNT